jgi:Ca2+-binding EF-hand superfamily protein
MAPQAYRGSHRRAVASDVDVETTAAGGSIPERIPPAGPSIDSAVSSIGSVDHDHTDAGSSEHEQDQQPGPEIFSDDVVYYHDGGIAKKKQIAVLWDHVDADGSGNLDRSEVHTMLVELDVDADAQDVAEAMSKLDSDGNGEISFEEFASWYLTYADESATQATTTVASLTRLADSGHIDDNTYMWTEAFGDDWVTYAEAKALMGDRTFDGLSTRTQGVGDDDQHRATEEAVPEGEPAASATATSMDAARSPRLASTVQHTAIVHYQDGGAARTQEIQALWNEVDVDQSGDLDREEVQAVLNKLGIADDEVDLDAAIDTLDKNKDGEIDFNEFVSWYLQRESDNGTNQHSAQTTVGGLLCGGLVKSGIVTDETYVWVDGLGDDWLTYAEAKELLPSEAECLAAMETEMKAKAVAAAHKRARAVQIIGTLDSDSPVYYAVGEFNEGEDERTRRETTVAGLSELVEKGDVTDDTMMWAEGMGDTWLPYSAVKPLLPGPKASDGAVLLRITQADGSVHERTATVGEVAVLLVSGEIDASSEIRMEGETTFQTLAEVRDASASPKTRNSPGKDGESYDADVEEESGNGLAGIGAAMEQANAEAWEHTEVRRLQAVDSLKEAEQQIEDQQTLIVQAQQVGDEEAEAELTAGLSRMQEQAESLKAELAWLEAEIGRISEQLAMLFGQEAARAFLRSRSLAMAMMHDDVLAQASKDILAATRNALAEATAGGTDGQIDVSTLLGSMLSAGGEGGGLQLDHLSKIKGSLTDLAGSSADATALAGAAQAGKSSSADGAALLEKVQTKMVQLHEEGETLSGGAADVSRVLGEQPELLADIKKLISLYIESTVMAMAIPDIAGDKDWGRYSLEGLAIAEVSLPPEGLDLIISTGVALSMRGVSARLHEFVWHYAKTKGFPKLKDEGAASASIVDMDIDVSFDLVANADGAGLALSNLKGHITLGSLDVSVGDGGKAGKGQQWLYNKLLKAFSDQISTVVEREMQQAMRQSLAVVQDKVSAAIAMFTGGEAAGAAALADLGLTDQPTLYLVKFKCTVQTGPQPYSQTVSALGVGKVVEILGEECTEDGVTRFRTTAGWSNRYQYNQSAAGMKKYSRDNPRPGVDVLQQLDPEEIPLALAKSETDLAKVEEKVWQLYVEGAQGQKKELKAALKDQKRAKTSRKGQAGVEHRAAYSRRLETALRAVQKADGAGRWQFSEGELLALAEAKVVDGKLEFMS